VTNRGRTAYVYFDNDQKSATPKDASRLGEMLSAGRGHAAA
jgi:uncharacterized protein YecE (DUF72 family)